MCLASHEHPYSNNLKAIAFNSSWPNDPIRRRMDLGQQ